MCARRRRLCRGSGPPCATPVETETGNRYPPGGPCVAGLQAGDICRSSASGPTVALQNVQLARAEGDLGASDGPSPRQIRMCPFRPRGASGRVLWTEGACAGWATISEQLSFASSVRALSIRPTRRASTAWGRKGAKYRPGNDGRSRTDRRLGPRHDDPTATQIPPPPQNPRRAPPLTIRRTRGKTLIGGPSEVYNPRALAYTRR
jgi:hypothetical protein